MKAWQIHISNLSNRRNKLAHWFEATSDRVMVTAACGKLINPRFAEPAGTDAKLCGDCVRKIERKGSG